MDTSLAPFGHVSRKLCMFELWQSFDMLCVDELVSGRGRGLGSEDSIWRKIILIIYILCVHDFALGLGMLCIGEYL